MGIELERPALPEDETDPADGGDAIFAAASQYALEHDVRPAVGNEFAKSRVSDVVVLVQCMERRRRFARDLDAIERGEIAALLHTRPASKLEAFAQLDDALREGRIDHEPALRYLARRSYRDEWLHAPAAALYPDRQWSPID